MYRGKTRSRGECGPGIASTEGISMSYHDLDVWQKSIELAEMSYRLSARFPREERFGITSQMRRSAASVAANIAEGANRHSLKDTCSSSA